MTAEDDDNIPQGAATPIETAPPKTTFIGVTDAFIAEIAELIDQDYIDRIQELAQDLSAADIAETCLKLNRERRYHLIDILEDILPPETFLHFDAETKGDLLDHMSPSHIAGIVSGLESDDALKLATDLDDERRALVLRQLSRRLRAELEEGLTYAEDSAGRMMQRDLVAIPQFWTVGKAADYLRAAAETLPERFHEVFIVDAKQGFVGGVALSSILCSPRGTKMDALVTEKRLSVKADTPKEDVARLFQREGLVSAAVVDADERLLGVITVDDIVDVALAAAEEDLLKLGGVADSDIHRPTLATARARFIWLAVNLVTAVIATAVISQFETVIAKFVALAALMPIVASMGGNAGTQTLAVAVRALATKDLSRANAKRVIAKETLVGAINGISFAVIVGGFVWLWYGDQRLGAIIAAAMVINLIAAGLSGIVIPFTLDKLKLDPATSAAVFLTTVTDVVGFFAFLGLAAAFLK
jgi:magnesium transporter